MAALDEEDAESRVHADPAVSPSDLERALDKYFEAVGYRNMQEVVDTIVECKYISHLRKWVPIGVRTDKHHPNNRRTFYKTLENIREDIQLNEFPRKV